MKRIIGMCGLILLLSGCTEIKTDDTVKVFKYQGMLSCNQNSGTSLEDMQQLLHKSRIPVKSAQCGEDGLMRAAVCGIQNGRVNVYEISVDDLPKASGLGFESLDQLKDFRAVSC